MDEFVKKQIAEMETNIFPLDRILPLSSVYRIFKEEYEKYSNKSIFFTDRKYQRLREGYFALFVAAALDKWEVREHFLDFPQSDSNDVNILSVKEINKNRSEFNKLICDVKEYTHHSESFEKFLQETIAPKIEIYNLIIGTHINVDIKPLHNLVQNQESTIWIVSSPTEDDLNYDISLVTMLTSRKPIEQQYVNLSEHLAIKNDQPMVIFQNLLRDKMILK